MLFFRSARERNCDICVITTEAHFASVFLGPHLRKWSSRDKVFVLGRGDYVPYSNERFREIPISRKPNIFQDVVCLFILVRILWRLNPEVLITLMPKSGLLGQAAGFICGVKHRVHIFTGQVWANRKGISRAALMLLDRLVSKIATSILTDSRSQRNILIDARICPDWKIRVLGAGSICGVNTGRFFPDSELKASERKRFGLTEKHFVFLFLGRLSAEKGVDVFLDMAVKLKGTKNLGFILAGSDEGNWARRIERLKSSGVSVNYIGYRSDSESVLRACDVLVLPSEREGFGNVVIEAGACNIPVLTTDIYGLADSVHHGVNGLKHAVGDIDGLVAQGLELSRNSNLYRKLGANGRKRALEHFDETSIVQEWYKFFEDLRRIR